MNYLAPYTLLAPYTDCPVVFHRGRECYQCCETKTASDWTHPGARQLCYECWRKQRARVEDAAAEPVGRTSSTDEERLTWITRPIDRRELPIALRDDAHQRRYKHE